LNEVALVPPLASAIVVPFQMPLAIVPRYEVPETVSAVVEAYVIVVGATVDGEKVIAPPPEPTTMKFVHEMPAPHDEDEVATEYAVLPPIPAASNCPFVKAELVPILLLKVWKSVLARQPVAETLAPVQVMASAPPIAARLAVTVTPPAPDTVPVATSSAVPPVPA
jgi:hypothetical protein